MGSSFPLGTGDAELAKSIVNRRLLKKTCVADSAIARFDLKAYVLVGIDEFPAFSESISSSGRCCNNLITIEPENSRLRRLPEKSEGLNGRVHEVIVGRAGKGRHFGEIVL
jgi:hypothetical protein